MVTELKISLDGIVSIGNAGSHYPTTGKVQDVMTNAFGLSRPRTGILPPAVRWISHDRRSFLVERPPQIMSIQFCQGKAADIKAQGDQADKEIFLIPLPWTTYFIQFTDISLSKISNIYMFGRTSPVQSMNDELLKIPLPNFMEGGLLCLGHKPNSGYNKTLLSMKANRIPITVATCINTAMTVIWQGGFNNDCDIFNETVPTQLKTAAGIGNYPLVPNHQVENLLRIWEGFTIDEILAWDWKSWEYPGMHVYDICKRVDIISKNHFKTIGHVMTPVLGAVNRGNFF